jgi:hypothetical protein
LSWTVSTSFKHDSEKRRENEIFDLARQKDEMLAKIKDEVTSGHYRI